MGGAGILNSTLHEDGRGLALAAAGPVLGAVGNTEKLAQESVTVYQIVKDGKVTYVGITNNIAGESWSTARSSKK